VATVEVLGHVPILHGNVAGPFPSVEVKLLHEGIGHTVTCELKTGVLVGIGFAKSEGILSLDVFIYFFWGGA